MHRSDRADTEFSDFVAARSTGLWRSAYLLTGSSHSADDLVQIALAKAYASWWRVRTAEDPAAYVHGVLIKSFLSERRRRSSSELPVAEVHRDAHPLGDPAEGLTERMALMRALAGLNPVDRAVVVLRFAEDQSIVDTADRLGLSPAAVKNRTLRALRTLRELLTETHGSQS